MSGSFDTAGAYLEALRRTPARVAARWRSHSGDSVKGTAQGWKNAAAAMKGDMNFGSENKAGAAAAGSKFQRELRWWDVLGLGMGGMLGAGIFLAIGPAARWYAGPSLPASFAVAGAAALLSALCYSDFAVALPAAGGAFSYLHATFGELAAFLTGANMVMEYVISNAAVARSFTSNLSAVFGSSDPEIWRIRAHGLARGYDRIDLPALALITIITLFICRSTKHSSTFNILITALHLSLIAFIIVAGFVKGSVGNLTEPDGIAPNGMTGIFDAAAVVFFSYSGYDSVSTLAEECNKPAKEMPLGICGSVVAVTILYCLMAASLVLMVPYDQVNVHAPFPFAFKQAAPEWKWAANVVAICACIGIVSSLMVAMLGQARYMCVIGRTNIVPRWFANVNAATGTPVNSSLSLGLCTAMVALFTDMEVLLDMISIATLFVYYMVANAVIMRRYAGARTSSSWPTTAFLLVVTLLSVAFVTIWRLQDAEGRRRIELAVCGAAIVAASAAFKVLVPQGEEESAAFNPTGVGGWRAPWMPFVAVASIFANVFLAGASMKVEAWKRFGVWTAAALCFYGLYSVHAAHDAAAEMAAAPPGLAPEAAELAGGGTDVEIQLYRV